jgi:hypothetical protein
VHELHRRRARDASQVVALLPPRGKYVATQSGLVGYPCPVWAPRGVALEWGSRSRSRYHIRSGLGDAPGAVASTVRTKCRRLVGLGMDAALASEWRRTDRGPRSWCDCGNQRLLLGPILADPSRGSPRTPGGPGTAVRAPLRARLPGLRVLIDESQNLRPVDAEHTKTCTSTASSPARLETDALPRTAGVSLPVGVGLGWGSRRSGVWRDRRGDPTDRSAR